MDPQAPSYVITGTGVPGQLAANLAYFPFWISGRADAIKIPGWGLGHLDDSYKLIEELLIGRIERWGVPALLGGHSQGGYHAVRFGLDHPDMVHTVMTISTPFSGLNTTVRGLRRWMATSTGKLPAGRTVADLAGIVWGSAEERVERLLHKAAPSLHSLAFLGLPVQELRDKVERDWHSDVRLVQIAGEGDRFVKMNVEDQTALDLAIPNEEMLFKYFLGKKDPGNLAPGVKFRRARRSGHLFEVFEPELHKLVVRYSRTHRETPITPLPIAEAG